MEDLRPRTTLFCAVLALAIALSMLLRGRRAAHWLFAAFSLEVALWWGSQSLYGLFQATIWARVTAVLTVLLPQFAVHLFQSIVPLDSEAERPSALTKFATAVGIPMLVLELSPYHEAPLSLGLVYFYVFGLIAAALVSMARRGQRSPSRAVRDRVNFLFAVGAAATTFTLADFLSFLGVRLPPIGAVLSIVFLFVLAESLARPRLADLYEMAGRLLVATALAFALAGIFYVFVTYIGRFNTMYLNAVLAAIVFLVLFEPLQTEVETRMHQFFFRERYVLETSIDELKRRLSHVLEIDQMADTVLEGLENSHRVTSCAIYLRDQDGNGFDMIGSIGEEPIRRLETVTVRPLLDRLQATRSMSFEEIAREHKDSPLLAVGAATLGPHKNSVLVAVKGDDEEIVGIICIADERMRDAFTPEEIALLETVASQIGVAIANSRIYSRMKERDRLAALGAMAAGLAHEVKNPLGAIKGAAQLLEESGESGPASGSDSREFVGIILEEVDRLNRVVASFLDYARPHAGNPVPLDINAAVRRTMQILTSQKADSLEFHLELTDPLPRAKIDPEQFRQVLINFIQNAAQAMDGRGRITVSTARRTRRRPWPSRQDSERPAVSERNLTNEVEMVEVSVRDTGPGISQKVLKHIFVPFFTTKEQGTGLGLAISQSIVQNAGGTIDVQTLPGAGTTFTILLPAATDALRTPLPTAAPTKPLTIV
ncbi:ATP-binding protein [Pendulispora albinea]|uniref:histidine kinase n=1 Tax=Pendulispora albinea TaxID=2741071 RepID=A0ABZ2M1A9_9BACT